MEKSYGIARINMNLMLARGKKGKTFVANEDV
jgi:hypothetical protein